MSRRRLLVGGGIAATVAVGGGGVVALTRGEGASTPPPPANLPTPTAASNAPPSTATPAGPRGGTARLVSPASFSFDTFDAQRTGEVSVAEILGRTHSRIVTWRGFPNASIGGDLAMRWEQPDATTWTFHLDPAARWQEREPLNGRSLTADDVVGHFTRTLSVASGGGLPMAQRGSDYRSIRRVTAPDSSTVVFECESPDPFMLDTLAGRFALIQAPEAVAKFSETWSDQHPQEVAGSGPFTLAGVNVDGIQLTSWGGGHGRPFVDGIQVGQPGRDIEAFLAKNADEFVARDRRDTASIRAAHDGDIVELERLEDSPVMSSFSNEGAPWNNAELVAAISGALNRTALGTALFGGRSRACGPVSPATPGFALTETDLASFAGYRADAKVDAADARARWAAAGGPGLGTVTVEFPSIFDPLYSASTVVTGLLNEVLGDQFRPAIDTYTAISQKVADGKYGNGRAAFWFGWGPPLRSPDPSREFVQAFDLRRNGAARASAQSAELSAAFDAVGAEMDTGVRAALVKDASRRLLTGGSPVVPWLLQKSELFRWSYLQRAVPTPFWEQQLDVDLTVDVVRRGFA